MKTQMQKENKGVTLITLVVTIIVLIILAGVSINTLVGENGIITKAKDVKQDIILASREEAIYLNQLYEEIDSKGEITGEEGAAIDKLLEFKRIIAKAITDKGVPTLETDTAEKMAENIGKIAQGGNNKYFIYEGNDMLKMSVQTISGSGNIQNQGSTIGTAGIELYMVLKDWWYKLATDKFLFNTTFSNNGYSSLQIPIELNGEISSCTVYLMDENDEVIASQEVTTPHGQAGTGTVIFNDLPSNFRLALKTDMHNSGPSEKTGTRRGTAVLKNIELY